MVEIVNGRVVDERGVFFVELEGGKILLVIRLGLGQVFLQLTYLLFFLTDIYGRVVDSFVNAMKK